MGCWEMLFWSVVLLAGVFVVEMIVKGLVLIAVVKQCKTLEEVEKAAKAINKEE